MCVLAVTSWLPMNARAQCPQTELVPAPGAADDYGIAVAISGDNAVVGDPREDNPAWGAPGLDAGAVYFARRSGGVWGPANRLYPAASVPQANGEAFGSAVALDDLYAVIGAPTFDTSTVVNCGAAYVYYFNGTSWVFQQRLLAFDTPGVPNPRTGETFGRSVAIDGETIVVGAPQNTSGGRACVYRFNGSSWVDWQRLLHPFGVGGDQFGRAVDISADRIVVGAPYDDGGGYTDLGSAVVFQESGGVWSQLGFVQTSPFAENYVAFGAAVAIGGNTMLAGAPGNLSGQGLVWCHEWTGSSWSVFAFNPAPTAGFGSAVDIDGDVVVGGAPTDDLPGLLDAGAAYVYRRVAGVWSANPTDSLRAPTPAAQQQFGSAVSVSGTDVLVGAPGGSPGWAYVNPVSCPPPSPQPLLMFAPATSFATGDNSVRVVVEDFDADGNLDVAALGTLAPSVRARWGDGAGGFLPTVWMDGLTAPPTALATADFDADGYMDLAVSSATGQAVWFFRYVGNRTFIHQATYVHPFGPQDLVAGEFTGDCRVDLATVNGVSNNLTIIQNNGGWSFTTRTSLGTGSNPRALAVGDIDRDGDDDLAVAHQGMRYVLFYRNQGAGAFAQAGNSPTLFPSGQIDDIVLADLDGDADLDCVVPNAATGQIIVGYFNNPNFAAGTPVNVGGATFGVQAGDIDGDGDADVLVSDQSATPRLIVLQNYGGGTFAPQTNLLGLAGGPNDIALGDLDFDGALDIVVSAVPNGYSVVMNLTDQDCNQNGIADQSEPLATLQIAVVGPSNGTSCAWAAVAAGLSVGASRNGCSPNGSPATEMAERFTRLIRQQGIPALRARRVSGWPSLFEIAAPGPSVDLCVGPAGGAPNCCLASAGICTCNPDLVRLAAADCNHNGQDDALDIYLGVSWDTNGDGIPDECAACLADLDCDGDVDFFDIDPFVAKLGCPGLGETGLRDSCDAGCPWQNGDIDQDGDVDFFDIDPFVSRLGATCP
jgi:hypothetical protein